MADVRPKADSHPLLATSRARAFIDRSAGGGGRGGFYMQKQHSQL